MYYTIYKITNKLNGKFYIGKHQTCDLDDDYMGSGKRIKAAIKKYGIENFKKEILQVFETETEMNEAEARLVVLSEDSYNLCPGGQGGFGFINNNGMNGSQRGVETRLELMKDEKWLSDFKEKKKKGHTKTDRQLQLERWRKTFSSNGALKPNHFKGKKHLEETRKRISETKKAKGDQHGEKNSQYGRPRSEETKAKIRAALLAKRNNVSLDNDTVP